MKNTTRTDTRPAAIIYARVSLDEQKNNFSIPSQLRGLRKMAGDDGFQVPEGFEIVDDGYLGGEWDRPGFTKVRELCRTGIPKRIYAHSLDRWCRGLAMQMFVEEELAKQGVSIKF